MRAEDENFSVSSDLLGVSRQVHRGLHVQGAIPVATTLRAFATQVHRIAGDGIITGTMIR